MASADQQLTEECLKVVSSAGPDECDAAGGVGADGGGRGGGGSSSAGTTAARAREVERLEKLAAQLDRCWNSNVEGVLQQVLAWCSVGSGWAEPLWPIIQHVARTVAPDVRSNNDKMDVRQYIRFKKLPGGSKSECRVVDGVVCSKTVSHKEMSSHLSDPKLLLIQDCKELYPPNEFGDLGDMKAKEVELLNKVVMHVVSYRPHVVLVAGSLSFMCQENLRTYGMTLVLNVKQRLLQAVARVTQAEIVQDIVTRTTKPELGLCHSFYTETYTLPTTTRTTLDEFEEINKKTKLSRGGGSRDATSSSRLDRSDENKENIEDSFLSDVFTSSSDGKQRSSSGSGGRQLKTHSGRKSSPEKTYEKHLMFFTGCPAHLGCTILLRGGSLAELRRVKSVVRFMVFVLYNWRFEKSYLVQERAVFVSSASRNVEDDHEDLLDELVNVASKGKETKAIVNIEKDSKDIKEMVGKTNEESLENDAKEGVLSEKKKDSDPADENVKCLADRKPENAAAALRQTATPVPQSPSRVSEVKDYSDPLRSITPSGGRSSDDPDVLVDTLGSDVVERSAFRRALSDVVLCTSPYVKKSLPFLESEAGMESPLRKFFPDTLYYSALLDKATNLRRGHERQRSQHDEASSLAASGEGKPLEQQRPKVHVREAHPLLTTDFSLQEDSAAQMLAYAGFKATGNQLHMEHDSAQCSTAAAADSGEEEELGDFDTRPWCWGQNRTNKHKRGSTTVPKLESGDKEKLPPCWGESGPNGLVDALHLANHQQLTVLFSCKCMDVHSTSFCVEPCQLVLEFYGKNDSPLGAFLETYYFADYKCLGGRSSGIGHGQTPPTGSTRSGGKKCTAEFHCRRFYHNQACVQISGYKVGREWFKTTRGSCLKGEEEDRQAIWMWNWCSLCKKPTPTVLMSPITWTFSLAKYLEIWMYAGGTVPSSAGDGSAQKGSASIPEEGYTTPVTATASAAAVDGGNSETLRHSSSDAARTSSSSTTTTTTSCGGGGGSRSNRSSLGGQSQTGRDARGGSGARRGCSGGLMSAQCQHPLHRKNHRQIFYNNERVAVVSFLKAPVRIMVLPPTPLPLSPPPPTKHQLVEEIRQIAVKGYSVYEGIQEKIPSHDTALQLRFARHRAQFKALYENIQLQLTSHKLEGGVLQPSAATAAAAVTVSDAAAPVPSDSTATTATRDLDYGNDLAAPAVTATSTGVTTVKASTGSDASVASEGHPRQSRPLDGSDAVADIGACATTPSVDSESTSATASSDKTAGDSEELNSSAMSTLSSSITESSGKTKTASEHALTAVTTSRRASTEGALSLASSRKTSTETAPAAGASSSSSHPCEGATPAPGGSSTPVISPETLFLIQDKIVLLHRIVVRSVNEWNQKHGKKEDNLRGDDDPKPSSDGRERMESTGKRTDDQRPSSTLVASHSPSSNPRGTRLSSGSAADARLPGHDEGSVRFAGVGTNVTSGSSYDGRPGAISGKETGVLGSAAAAGGAGSASLLTQAALTTSNNSAMKPHLMESRGQGTPTRTVAPFAAVEDASSSKERLAAVQFVKDTLDELALDMKDGEARKQEIQKLLESVQEAVHIEQVTPARKTSGESDPPVKRKFLDRSSRKASGDLNKSVEAEVDPSAVLNIGGAGSDADRSLEISPDGKEVLLTPGSPQNLPRRGLSPLDREQAESQKLDSAGGLPVSPALEGSCASANGGSSPLHSTVEESSAGGTAVPVDAAAGMSLVSAGETCPLEGASPSTAHVDTGVEDASEASESLLLTPSNTPRPALGTAVSSGPKVQEIKLFLASLWPSSASLELKYPFSPTSHFRGLEELRIPVVVQREQVSSIIAHALASKKYHMVLKDNLKQCLQHRELLAQDVATADQPQQRSVAAAPASVPARPMTNITLTWQDHGTFTCVVYFSAEFHMLRRLLLEPGGDQAFIRSLSASADWATKGGKSKSAFCKTLDDRFVLKEMKSTEHEPIDVFCPAYIDYITKAHNTNSPSALARIFGIFSIAYSKSGKVSKQPPPSSSSPSSGGGGGDSQGSSNPSMSTSSKPAPQPSGKLYMVMENLFYKHRISTIYDLKGNTSNRTTKEGPNASPGDVYLDCNLKLHRATKDPLLVSPCTSVLLPRAITPDCAFLKDCHIMDYSLLVGVTESAGDSAGLVVGIIDYMRKFTHDKFIENFVKESVLRTEDPTIVSPAQYMKRFTNFIPRYFDMVPDSWTGLDILDRQLGPGKEQQQETTRSSSKKQEEDRKLKKLEQERAGMGYLDVKV